MTERWLPIPGFADYQVSDHGRIWSNERSGVRSDGHRYWKPGRMLKPFPARDGYPQVRIARDDGQCISRKTHLLVLETFVGPCPKGMEACHGPDGYLNAGLSNLSWGTRSENMLDRQRDGVAFARVGVPTGKTHLELSSDRRRALRAALSDEDRRGQPSDDAVE